MNLIKISEKYTHIIYIYIILRSIVLETDDNFKINLKVFLIYQW